MAKTLQDYLGQSATLENGNLSVNINDLYGIIYPDKTLPANIENKPSVAIALLLTALNTTAAPTLDENNLEVQDHTQGVTSSKSLNAKSFETREGVPQIKHEFVFNIYNPDNTDFDPTKTI